MSPALQTLNAEVQEFVDTLERTVRADEVLFVCAFSIYQNEELECKSGCSLVKLSSKVLCRITQDLASLSRSVPPRSTAPLDASSRTSRISTSISKHTTSSCSSDSRGHSAESVCRSVEPAQASGGGHAAHFSCFQASCLAQP